MVFWTTWLLDKLGAKLGLSGVFVCLIACYAFAVKHLVGHPSTMPEAHTSARLSCHTRRQCPIASQVVRVSHDCLLQTLTQTWTLSQTHARDSNPNSILNPDQVLKPRLRPKPIPETQTKTQPKPYPELGPGFGPKTIPGTHTWTDELGAELVLKLRLELGLKPIPELRTQTWT